MSQRRIYPVAIKRREADGEGGSRMRKVLKTLTTQRERHADADGVKLSKFIRGSFRSSKAHHPMTGNTKNSALNKDLEILESY